MSDDKIYILLLGVLIGIPIGVVLFKQLFQQGTTAVKTNYGAQYGYDENGRLISYMPVPIPNGG